MLSTLAFAWCKEDEARLDPQFYDSHEEYLQDIPKQPDNWSEGSYVQKMKIDFGPRGSATMPEIALITLARQKYDATGNFGLAIPLGAVIEGTSPDEALRGRYHQGQIPPMGHSSFLFEALETSKGLEARQIVWLKQA